MGQNQSAYFVRNHDTFYDDSKYIERTHYDFNYYKGVLMLEICYLSLLSVKESRRQKIRLLDAYIMISHNWRGMMANIRKWRSDEDIPLDILNEMDSVMKRVLTSPINPDLILPANALVNGPSKLTVYL